MPAFDLPLAELEHYLGTNPRPTDFEAYWNQGLAELASHDPAVELVPNPTLDHPAAACFDLWFTGVGGARIYAKYVRPRVSTGAGPAVLRFHGYSHYSGDWMEAVGYASAGIALAAMDCRGQGGRSEDVGGVQGSTLRGAIVRGLDDPDPTKLLFRSVFLDAALLARIVMSMEEVDANRVGTLGGSQGGGLALACAALVPEIKRISAVFPFLCDYLRVWEMDLAKAAYEELRLFLRKSDPRHERVVEIFTKLGYIDVQHLAPRVRGEVQMFTGLMDQVCPPSSQFAAYNKLKGTKSMLVYPDFEHEALPDQADRSFMFLRGL
jgi:cephalosporin-C deacetylase